MLGEDLWSSGTEPWSCRSANRRKQRAETLQPYWGNLVRSAPPPARSRLPLRIRRPDSSFPKSEPQLLRDPRRRDLLLFRDAGRRQPRTARNRHSPDPGGNQASIPCRPSVSGAKSTRASNSRLLEGVFSTDAVMRSPLSPNVPSCPVAIRRAFSFGCAPEPSETTTSGPSSSQRSRGRLAAERSVHAQSSFWRIGGARLSRQPLHHFIESVQGEIDDGAAADPHIFAQRGQERSAHRLDCIAARARFAEWRIALCCRCIRW